MCSADSVLANPGQGLGRFTHFTNIIQVSDNLDSACLVSSYFSSLLHLPSNKQRYCFLTSQKLTPIIFLQLYQYSSSPKSNPLCACANKNGLWSGQFRESGDSVIKRLLNHVMEVEHWFKGMGKLAGFKWYICILNEGPSSEKMVRRGTGCGNPLRRFWIRREGELKAAMGQQEWGEVWVNWRVLGMYIWQDLSINLIKGVRRV